ncbi:hypothetical protein EJB05_27579, partial [Eragrostis curvula]
MGSTSAGSRSIVLVLKNLLWRKSEEVIGELPGAVNQGGAERPQPQPRRYGDVKLLHRQSQFKQQGEE